jgi:hypothetical protein
MPFETILNEKVKSVAKWQEILRFSEDLEQSKPNTEWIFRGQDCDELPSPVLERKIKSLGIREEDAFYVEFALFDRFIRNICAIDQSLQNNFTKLEMLALMRHYGAPTRLVDFTYSFYVALFFAIENFQGKSPVIWAIDALWLQERVRDYLNVKESFFMPGKIEKEFTKYFLREDDPSFKPFVYQVTPNFLNTRISIQQGTFLCPSDIRFSFRQNFASVWRHDDKPDEAIRLLRISPDLRIDALKRLYRMNITNASLFPGIDGFAKSLGQTLLFGTSLEIFKEKRKALIEKERCEPVPFYL